MNTMRKEKVAQLIKKEVSEIIHSELKDPRIGFVTITRVEITPDLHRAKVYFSILGNIKDTRKTSEGLKSASNYIRKLIGRRLKLRFTPEVLFCHDRSIEYSIHIDETIERIKEK